MVYFFFIQFYTGTGSSELLITLRCVDWYKHAFFNLA